MIKDILPTYQFCCREGLGRKQHRLAILRFFEEDLAHLVVSFVVLWSWLVELHQNNYIIRSWSLSRYTWINYRAINSRAYKSTRQEKTTKKQN